MKARTFKRHLQIVICAVAAFAITSYGGTLTVKFGSAMEVEIDGAVQSFTKNATFTPTAIPCIYKMRPANMAEGERTFGIGSDVKISGNYNHWRFPQYGDGNWVRVALDPYPESDNTVTLTGYKTSNFFYVDAEHGNDTWDGTTDYEHRDESNDKGPKKSLQAANDAATGNYPIVLAAPGIYNTGVATNYSSGTSNPCIRRLIARDRSIGFIATEGAENTFIVGAPDTSAANGNGPESVGGVYMHYGSSALFLQGFTITGCYAPADQASNNQYGTAFGSGGTYAYCLDCVISNNHAEATHAEGAVINNGVMERVRIIENESYEYITRNGVFISCIFAGNRMTYGDDTKVDSVLHYNGRIYFCTYDLRNELQSSGRKRLEGNSSNLRAALVYGLTDKSTTNATRWLSKSQAIDAPLFANADARDYRLRIKSPVRNVSSYEDDLNDMARMLMTSDVDGRMPVLHDGKVSLGALWNEPQVWYVAQDGGNDANDGASPETAKATINAAIARSFSGDTIRVAPGTYGADEGDQRTSETDNAGFRVILPEDVTVESTDGAEKTFIVGAEATGDNIDNETYKTGTNAVRCVFANEGSTVRGFTLTGGRGVGAVSSVDDPDGKGAAFYSATTSNSKRGAALEDCIVSNNVAANATISYANVRRCRIFGNVATFNPINGTYKAGSAGTGCNWYGTIIDNNVGDGTMFNPGMVENCTVGSGNTMLSGSNNARVLSRASAGGVINNTVILGGRAYGISTYNFFYFTNCVVKSDGTTWTNIDPEHAHNTYISSSVAASVDGEYRPTFGSFVGIDMCGMDYSSDEVGDRDVYGTPRVLNGAIDVGAVEYDWRPTFAAELGWRFTMTYASPTVTTNATGGVKLDGDIGALGDRALPVCIAGTVSEAGPYAFTFALTGGSAAVYVGGVLAGEASGAGEQSIRFDVPDASAEIRFTFTPDAETPGAAILRKFAGARGFSISFR